MSFVSYLKRQSEGDDPFLGLESDMSEALEKEFAAEAVPSRSPENKDAGEPVGPENEGRAAAKTDRMTSNSKKYLAGLETFEAQFKDSQSDLKELSEKVANLSVAQHLTRDFLNLMQAGIFSANEMELTNKDLLAKNRMLATQLDSMRSLNLQLKAGIEDLQGRESKLRQEKEVLRSGFSSANAELEEARKEAADRDNELSELRRELGAKSTMAEKLSRDNELIREKHVNLSVDLDAALKTASDLRRKHDEMATNLKGTAGELTEALAQLADARKEITRINRELEARSAQLTETTEILRTAEYERDEAANKHNSEIQSMRSENQNLDNRFQAASREQAKATEELIALKLKFNDAVSEKRVVEEKLAALTREIEDERRQHSVTSTKLSELNLDRASEKVVNEAAQQQLRDEQKEIAKLRAEVKRLLPYERLYRVKKEELQCAADAETPVKAEEPNSEAKPANEAKQAPEAKKTGDVKEASDKASADGGHASAEDVSAAESAKKSKAAASKDTKVA